MKNKLVNNSNVILTEERLFGSRMSPYHQPIRRAIVKQVMAEYQSELDKATGWRRRWVNWKISIIIDMRYNEILFSGRFGRVVRSGN